MTLSLAVAGAGVALRVPERTLVHGLAVGASSGSFEPPTVFTALDLTAGSGAHLLEISAGDSLDPARPEIRIGDELSEEDRARLRQRLSLAAARFIAARVRFSDHPSANAHWFEWAGGLDIPMLVGDPPPEQLDTLETLIRRHNIAVGIVTALGDARRTSSTNTTVLLRTLRGRDSRMGVVVNVLNLVRAGVDPFAAISALRTRLLGIQVTDLDSLEPTARPVPFGEGRFDFHRLLRQLAEERYTGYLAFEWPGSNPAFPTSLNRGVEFIEREMEAIRRRSLLQLAARGVRMARGLSYEVLVQGNLPEPIHVAPCPDGSVWIGSRLGHIWSWSESSPTNTTVGHLAVLTTGQRGLYAFAFDPGFLTNGHLYVYRAPMSPVGNWNRVSRFTAGRVGTSWRVQPASELTLLDVPSASHGQQQGGGFLLHPQDRCLYIGIGDNRLPTDTQRDFADPNHPAQDPFSAWGKILRIRSDGGIPADNPFADGNFGRLDVFALGLRNPFSLSCDPVSGRVYAGDVGYDRRQDREEINWVRPAGNYGWPRCDGRGLDFEGAACALPDAIGPWHAYPHGSAAAVVVGPFPGQRWASSWPQRSDGLIYGDFARRSIHLAAIDPAEHVVTNVVTIASSLGGGPISMAMSTNGELFIAEYAGWLSAMPTDRLSRILPDARVRQPATRSR
jgi:glucose/arabinose dehydrogenase/sugar phosphate isomerase/epimerase